MLFRSEGKERADGFAKETKKASTAGIRRRTAQPHAGAPRTIWEESRHAQLSATATPQPTSRYGERLNTGTSPKKTKQGFLWKFTYNASKIGEFWRNVPNFERRRLCIHRFSEGIANSAPYDLWRHPRMLPNKLQGGSKRDQGLNRLNRIIVSESRYTVWKIRCERTTTWENDTTKAHPTTRSTTSGYKPQTNA